MHLDIHFSIAAQGGDPQPYMKELHTERLYMGADIMMGATWFINGLDGHK